MKVVYAIRQLSRFHRAAHFCILSPPFYNLSHHRTSTKWSKKWKKKFVDVFEKFLSEWIFSEKTNLLLFLRNFRQSGFSDFRIRNFFSTVFAHTKCWQLGKTIKPNLLMQIRNVCDHTFNIFGRGLAEKFPRKTHWQKFLAFQIVDVFQSRKVSDACQLVY